MQPGRFENVDLGRPSIDERLKRNLKLFLENFKSLLEEHKVDPNTTVEEFARLLESKCS